MIINGLMSRRKQTGRRPFERSREDHSPHPNSNRRHQHPLTVPLRQAAATDGRYWMYGVHAVIAALRNNRRRVIRLLTTTEAERQAEEAIAAGKTRLGERMLVERASSEAFARHLGEEAVHQGLAAEVLPLTQPDLDTTLSKAGPEATFLLLDQVTDPHNVGAILRSATAFGASGIVTTRHHSPMESGSLAKAASGGLEGTPLIRVANLGQALDALKKSGFWCLGLAADGAELLAKANLSGRIAFVLGAEGAGLRRLTREHCDLLVRLPTETGLVQLNVSNAAAIALYERARATNA
jgi:23S rRNA (guanosine2251-2'-O)-methyltransferase